MRSRAQFQRIHRIRQTLWEDQDKTLKMTGGWLKIEDWRLSLTLSPSGWQSWLSWLRLLAYLTVFATLQTLPQLIKLVSFNKFHEIYFLECSVRLWETFLATIVIPNCIHPMIMTAFLRGTPNTDHQKFIQMMFSEFYLNWNKVCHKYTLSDPQGLVVSR